MKLAEERKSRLAAVLAGLRGLAGSYGMTLRHLFRKPLTEMYPEEQRQLPERSRARIVLTRDPDGNERCVACYLCSGVCPVSCISMESAEDDAGRRYARWFRINFARCIYCGLCEEACPTLAIQLTPDFEFSSTGLLELVAEKKDLLVEHGGKNREYDFYRHAGIVAGVPKGGHLHEKAPVDYKSNLP